MMCRSTTHSTREWIAAHARELTASGLIDLIRRRCALQLAVQNLAIGSRTEQELGVKPCDPHQIFAPRRELQALWAEIESARVGFEDTCVAPHEGFGE